MQASSTADLGEHPKAPRPGGAGPHQGQPIHAAGRALDQAKAALILLHGRGATAQSILLLAEELHHPAYAYLAPQAAGNTWYPYTFLAPIASNEPWLSSALAVVGGVVAQVERAGIPAERIVIGGFSQGACLAAEYVARNARRYGGLLVFSGGLIGPPGTPRDYPGHLDGMPIFLGCGDGDPHIPRQRVEESAQVFERMGADVTTKLYPGMGHTIAPDELDGARAMAQAVANTH
jgi:predicted esterase